MPTLMKPFCCFTFIVDAFRNAYAYVFLVLKLLRKNVSEREPDFGRQEKEYGKENI